MVQSSLALTFVLCFLYTVVLRSTLLRIGLRINDNVQVLLKEYMFRLAIIIIFIQNNGRTCQVKVSYAYTIIYLLKNTLPDSRMIKRRSVRW